ncbi:enoyl-CoA hydratase-related protein [Aminobacter sp. MSH1]|uniref:enoyl-CoA hydratase-related protein n=1 Tax=Aminobacter sp. MSH1 TaxID=374606 RepID=UPI000D34A624|nr:enoyl-CoA hydratase-related protein [Aminobacter sp. MSH1]
MGTNTDKVLYEKSNHVAVITMNRPERMNAFDTEAFRGLADAFISFDSDPDAHVAVLTGAGERAFSAGVDLKERVATGEPGLGFPDIAPLVNPFWPGRSNRIMKPVIAAVNGYAMGGGFYMALEADICIASMTAQFELSEILRGCVAGWEVGFLHNLPRSVWAEIAFGGRLSAQRAYDVGIVTEVVPQEELMDAARARAESILRVTPLVRRRNLELLRSLKPRVPAQLWSQEAAHIEECRNDPDAEEAVAAFLERRAPVWRTRSFR